jgi:hypothetical protein
VAYQERPERNEYRLTPAGRELFPVIMGLMSWGDAHMAPSGPPAVVRHAGCGGVVGAGARCRTCEKPVGADDVEWWYGPGSRRPEGPRPRPPV